MPTPDSRPGPLQEEQIIMDDRSGEGLPADVRTIIYEDGAFRLVDASGAFDPRTGGTGLTPTSHEELDQLVHKIAETNYTEITRAAGKVTDIIVWTDNGKTTKIRETNITRTAGAVSQTVEKQYDGAGSLVQTLTSTFTRAGGKVASIDVVKT